MNTNGHREKNTSGGRRSFGWVVNFTSLWRLRRFEIVQKLHNLHKLALRPTLSPTKKPHQKAPPKKKAPPKSPTKSPTKKPHQKAPPTFWWGFLVRRAFWRGFFFGWAFWCCFLVLLFGGAFWWGFCWGFLVGLLGGAFWWGFLVGLFGGVFW